MPYPSLKALQNASVDTGMLKISAISEATNAPIEDAAVSISYTGNPTDAIEQLRTNADGQIDTLTLPTPPLEYSMEYNRPQPYSEYTITVSAPGFDDFQASGVEVLPLVTSLYQAKLKPRTAPAEETIYVIGPHTLYGDYPPKIAENEIKPIDESGEIVLSRVVVPETVIVHDGPPTDSSAKDYYVSYKDYVKNVASSEIYATWPKSTIRANILAIMSFTLNRVFTEWYRNRGFNFTITSSTAFDHKWIPGRNYYDTISSVVDELFANYLSRPNVRQPILTQYCDGKRVSCPNWMTQWGSKELGDQGFSPIEILRYYYGDDMYINSAEQISGIPSSWPGSNLMLGSSGQKVLQMQEQLNAISAVYTSIPSIAPDGLYGNATKEAVQQFQRVFGLPVTGVVDYPTWYKISEIYVGVTRIAELS